MRFAMDKKKKRSVDSERKLSRAEVNAEGQTEK